MGDSYPPDWDSRRQSVYERDNYTCQNCGRTAQNKVDIELHAHHIVPISKGGTHSKTNLSSMCSECHNAIHNNKKAPTAKGSLQTAEQMTNYQDVFELMTELPKLFKNTAPIHFSAHLEANGPEAVIQTFQKNRETSHKRAHNYKRKLSSFDPYDNADSDLVQNADFKSVVEQGIDMYIDVLNEFLELDRALQKYVSELTSIKCPECAEVHSESTEFCGDCGTKLSVLSKCAECGKTREQIDQSFCQNCGGDLNSYPQNQLDSIGITVEKLEELSQSCIDSTIEAKEFESNSIVPLWERELE